MSRTALLDTVLGRFFSRRRRVMSQLEIETVTHLAWAWNAYCSLEDRDCDDDREMQVAIHAAQAVLAVRMARRTEPGVWSAAVRKDAKT